MFHKVPQQPQEFVRTDLGWVLQAEAPGASSAVSGPEGAQGGVSATALSSPGPRGAPGGRPCARVTASSRAQLYIVKSSQEGAAEGPGGGGAASRMLSTEAHVELRVSTLAVPGWREAVRVPGEAGAELACARDAPCSLLSLL